MAAILIFFIRKCAYYVMATLADGIRQIHNVDLHVR